MSVVTVTRCRFCGNPPTDASCCTAERPRDASSHEWERVKVEVDDKKPRGSKR